MNQCSLNHKMVRYEESGCPVCQLISEKADLEKEVEYYESLAGTTQIELEELQEKYGK